jgi:hypothetical protein
MIKKSGYKENHAVYMFENGYGASIITTGYGSDNGLKEIAVLDSKSGRLVYDTPITSSVIGWLTDDEVIKILNKIRKLPPLTH